MWFVEWGVRHSFSEPHCHQTSSWLCPRALGGKERIEPALDIRQLATPSLRRGRALPVLILLAWYVILDNPHVTDPKEEHSIPPS